MIQEKYVIIELRSLVCLYTGGFLDCWEKVKESRLTVENFNTAILKCEDWKKLRLLSMLHCF